MGRDWKKAKFVVFTFEDLVMWREGGAGQGGGAAGGEVGWVEGEHGLSPHPATV